MVVKAAPTASLVMSETELLFELLIVPLDTPTRLGRVRQSLQTCPRRQAAEPVFSRRRFIRGHSINSHSSSRS